MKISRDGKRFESPACSSQTRSLKKLAEVELTYCLAVRLLALQGLGIVTALFASCIPKFSSRTAFESVAATSYVQRSFHHVLRTNVLRIERFTNISDITSTGFHPCEAGGNETLSTLFLDNVATCDDKFFKMFDDPEALLTGKNGSFLIMVSLRWGRWWFSQFGILS